MARHKCDDQDWILGARFKVRLFELWFGEAKRETPAHTARELERLIGAKGPKSLVDTLAKLLAIGLIRESGKTFEPVPFSELPPNLRALREALASILAALRQI